MTTSSKLGIESGARGATLLEVLVGTSILVALLGVGLPQAARLRAPYAARAAVQQIAADLQFARIRSIARNARHRVTFDAGARTYQVEREVTPGNFLAEGGAQELPPGVELGAVSPGNPVFDTRGMLVGDVTIQVNAPHAASRSVTINALGRAQLG